MKKNIYFFVSPLNYLPIFSLVVLLSLYSCEKESISEMEIENASMLKMLEVNSKSNVTSTFYGPAVSIGIGIAQTFVMMSHSGTPESVGIRFSEKYLENLPDTEEKWTLNLPQQVEGLLIDHIDFGWNPHGHVPSGIYDVPHFDFHFYTVSKDYVNNINDPAKAGMLPAHEFWPATYFPSPGFVPMMGKHWLSGLANELQPGGEFTQTFIYGSYESMFIFYEPMITLDYFNQKGNEQFDIFQPTAFQRNGYYPTSYSITYDSIRKEYRVVLENMVQVE